MTHLNFFFGSNDCLILSKKILVSWNHSEVIKFDQCVNNKENCSNMFLRAEMLFWEKWLTAGGNWLTHKHT